MTKSKILKITNNNQSNIEIEEHLSYFDAVYHRDEDCIEALYKYLYEDCIEQGRIQIRCPYCRWAYPRNWSDKQGIFTLHRAFRCTKCRRTHTLLRGTSLCGVRNNLVSHIRHRVGIKACRDAGVPINELSRHAGMEMRLIRRISKHWSARDDYDIQVFMMK